MNNDLVRITGEGFSVGVIVSSILGWLPAIAALASICWYGVLFYDRFKRKRANGHRRKGEGTLT